MEVTYLDHIRLVGPLTEFALSWSGSPDNRGAPLTFNQRNHLAAADANGKSTWIAGMLDIGGPDVWSDGDVESALHSVVASSSALRSVARDNSRHIFPADALTITVRMTSLASLPTMELDRLISARCQPGEVPGLFMARSGVTVIVAVDHFHADMLSIEMLLRRLWGALHTQPAKATAGAMEDMQSSVLSDTPEQTNPRTASKALSLWQKFFAVTDGSVPSFPVALASELTRPAHDVRLLRLADDISGDLDRRTFAVILTTLAEALEGITGSSEFATIIPVHTRGRRGDPRHGVIGWMVGNAPVVAHARGLDATHQWLRDAITVVHLPLETMMEQCSPELPPGVIPMVSYIDFRDRGEPLPRPRYISSTSPTDTVQLWFSRTGNGLAVRAKYPDTAVARRVMDQVLRDVEVGLSRYCDPRSAIIATE